MKVKEVMVGTPAFCSRDTNLGAAVEILWNRNCGIVPVIDAEGKVAGVVTDRDICIALGTRNRLSGEITVGEVASGKLFTCQPDDDIRTALRTMGQAQVRRLPVVNAEGKLVAILSMDDVVIHSESKSFGRTPELSHDDVMDTFKKVYQPLVPSLVMEKTAAA